MSQKVEDLCWTERQSTGSDDSEAAGSAVRKDGPSGPKIRSRPIDINQPMVVMFPETDDEFDGYFVHPKGFASPERPKLLRGSQVNVPIPIIRILKEKHASCHSRPFDRPKLYIRTPAALNDPNSKAVEYDLDEDDDRFLRALNELEVQQKRLAISEDEFEATIDFLEKEAYSKGGNSLPLIMSRCGQIILDERDIPCSVCWSPDTHESNDILFCDGCNVAVHQKCYGIDTVPEGEWRCDKCRIAGKAAASVRCFLCSQIDGAFRRHPSGRWYHVACAQQCPVSFEAMTRPPPGGVAPAHQHVQRQLFSSPTKEKKSSTKRRESWPGGVPEDVATPFERPGALCCLCDKSDGVSTVCREPGCGATFHVSCGHKNGFFFLSSLASPDSPTAVIDPGAYCRIHSLKPQYLQLRRLLFVPRTLAPADIDQLIATFRKSPRVPPLSNDAIEFIFRYWLMRRWSLGRSLIPRLDLLNKDREATEKAEEAVRKLQADYDRLVSLRQHLERVRILVDLSKKRELLKRLVLDSVAEATDLVDGKTRPKPPKPAAISVAPNVDTIKKPRGRPKKRKDSSAPLLDSAAKRAKITPAVDSAATPAMPRSPSSTASVSEVYESSPVAALPPSLPLVPEPERRKGPGRPRKSETDNKKPKQRRKRKREEAIVGPDGELLPPKPKKRKVKQPIVTAPVPAATSDVSTNIQPINFVDIKIEAGAPKTVPLVALPMKKKVKRPKAKRTPASSSVPAELAGFKLHVETMSTSVGDNIHSHVSSVIPAPMQAPLNGISASSIPSSVPTKVPHKKKKKKVLVAEKVS